MFYPKRKTVFPTWIPDIDNRAGKKFTRICWILVCGVGILVLVFVLGKLVPVPLPSDYEVFWRVEEALHP
ncbi:MAG TPA: hypothetical protein VLH40_02495 [Atribacteraceae bacterium]|nr:hypothetical protein [Atribacteraceae bacterium]